MLAYNGMIPGPSIRVKQGSKISITLKNDSPYETLLHSHGLRLTNRFDGTPLVQKPIKPGESFTYELSFPDPGIYWYHPHLREDLQQDLGMYGAFVVEPANETYWEAAELDQVVFVDDITTKNEEIPKNKDGATHTLMGEYGDVMLVNGAVNAQLHGKTGVVNRYYLINSANSRPFRLTIPGDAKMKLVGADNGAYENESFVDSVTLGPSERAVVDVVFNHEGTYFLENQTPEGTAKLAQIIVQNAPTDEAQMARFSTLGQNSEVIASIDPYRQDFDKEPDESIGLGVQMMGMGGGMNHMMMHGDTSGEGIEWEDQMKQMNEATNAQSIKWIITDQKTNKTNMDIRWQLKRGDLVKIHITNSAASAHPMQHPIHFHGNRFLVIARDGTPVDNLAWKDTTLVGAGHTVDILLEATNPGKWMAHCHIAEHLEAGMMMEYDVN